MCFANTIHTYPAFFIGGWIGIFVSMVLEWSFLDFYLRKRKPSFWIFRRFVLANVLSAVAGIPIFITRYYYPSGDAADNLFSLWAGVIGAFFITLVIECSVFLSRSAGPERAALFRAVVMSNFFSYAALVAIHLILA